VLHTTLKEEEESSSSHSDGSNSNSASDSDSRYLFYNKTIFRIKNYWTVFTLENGQRLYQKTFTGPSRQMLRKVFDLRHKKS
jgi:hypothetical protein